MLNSQDPLSESRRDVRSDADLTCFLGTATAPFAGAAVASAVADVAVAALLKLDFKSRLGTPPAPAPPPASAPAALPPPARAAGNLQVRTN